MKSPGIRYHQEYFSGKRKFGKESGCCTENPFPVYYSHYSTRQSSEACDFNDEETC